MSSHRVAPPQTGIRLMIGLLALTAAGKAVLYDTIDPDCFWHLRVADQLHRDGIGPLVDDISFASIKQPWTPYSWLAELGMKWIWDAGGYRAAVFVQMVLMGSFVAFVAMAIRARNSDEERDVATIVAVTFALYWALPYLSFRPVTIALVLIALVWWLIQRDRSLGESSRAIWCIVPLTALVANIHFFAFFVPAAMLATCIDSTRRRRSGTIGALTVLAACATPMLPGMVRSIAHYQFEDPMLSVGFINEFRPIYAGPTGLVSVSLLLGSLGCSIRNRAKLRLSDWIILPGAIGMMLRLGRFAPLYAIVAAPLLAVSLPHMSGRALTRRTVIAAASTVLVFGILSLAISFPRRDIPMEQWLNRHGPETPGYPCAAADFVRVNVGCPTGKLLNEFNWGGYLAWQLGDRFQVLMDGRTQLYTPDFWRAAYIEDRVDLEALTPDASRADAAVVPLDRSRLKSELIRAGWKVVYRDDRSEVLCPGSSTLASVAD